MPPNRMAPCQRRSGVCTNARITKTRAAENAIKLFRPTPDIFVGIARIRAGKPSASRTFAILDPTTLPAARSPSPISAAWTPTTISGAEVPKATIVKPTISAGTPQCRAKAAAPRTIMSPAMIKMTKPNKRKRNDAIMKASPSSIC